MLTASRDTQVISRTASRAEKEHMSSTTAACNTIKLTLGRCSDASTYDDILFSNVRTISVGALPKFSLALVLNFLLMRPLVKP